MRTLDMQGRIEGKGKRSISAKLVANLITVAGADRVLIWICMCHSYRAFDIPVDHLLGVPILTDILKKFSGLDDLVMYLPM